MATTAVGGVLLVVAMSSAQAAHLTQTVHGVTVSERLVTFSSGDPGTILSSVKITGLGEDEQLVGIDFRPATGQLYGVASLAGTGRLVVIEPASGVASPVGAATFGLVGRHFGVDFNPTVDRLRVVSDSGQNLRVNPVTGAVAATDGALAYAGSDPAFGADPDIVGVAYTNNDNAAATGTTLYDIDAARDGLVTQNPPNDGTLNTVGALGTTTHDRVGFDIWSALDASGAATANFAFASLSSPGRSRLYLIDLSTGAAGLLGDIGSHPVVTDIAIPAG